jgi:Cdc6-like AAA superfamily ATPase
MTDISENPNVELHGIQHLPFRMICVGTAGSGKSHFIFNVLSKFAHGKGTFETIHIVTFEKHTLHDVMKEFWPSIHIIELKDHLKNASESSVLPDFETMDRTKHHLVIFDEVDNYMEKYSSLQMSVKEYFLRSRVNNVSVICSFCRQLHRVPPLFVGIASHIAMLGNLFKRDVRKLQSFSPQLTEEQIVAMFKDKKMFEAIVYHSCNDLSMQFTRNFTERISFA